MTLRRRLILGITALLAAVIVIIGVLTVVSLRGFLVQRLDDQLANANGRSEIAFGGPEGPAGGVTSILQRPGQSEGTLVALVRSGVLVGANILNSNGEPVTLDQTAADGLVGLPLDGAPHTVTLGNEGQFRVISSQMPDGQVLVTGLPFTAVNETVLRLGILIGAIGLAGVAATAVAGTVVVRGALRPLERVAATATRVSELPLDRGDVALAERVPPQDADPRTEVGRVGAALNRMLEHVASALTARQASENKVRTFVADASHELRTPLASIRGYAELTRRGGHELPEDVVHALGRVESESVRMTALVEDLLLLARLDEGRALEGTDVDLSRLLVDAVADATVAGPDHEWRLDLPDEPVQVQGDGPRLHQVIANLLANARVHTPPGTTVTTSVHEAGDRIAIEVRDDGPGIDPALVPTVFERFARGDGSRSRAAGSTGLGLAIVSAVVEAHGGRAEVESEPGNTVFRILLPGARI
jgi:two-component system OmpR family sensor kinase